MNKQCSCQELLCEAVINSANASAWTKDGQYRNDLDLSIDDRKKFRLLQKELAQHDRPYKFTLASRHLAFAHLNFCHAEAALKYFGESHDI